MYRFEQTMRWYGPHDPVDLWHIRQAGCTGVVSALHHVPVGEVWTVDDIMKRRQLIAEAGLTWTVIESLPVSDDIKRRSGDYRSHTENYKQSIRNAAACGLKVITYNFMPVLDWLRTDVQYTLPDKSTALYFDRLAFVAFDLFMLQRPDAAGDYAATEIESAKQWYAAATPAQRQTVMQSCLLGLPGSDVPFTPPQVLGLLDSYAHINADALRQHLVMFLQEVVPVAEEEGMVMAIHPDDPPYPLLGLPRIMSCAADMDYLAASVPSIANGFCFCTGSFGVRPDNNLTNMIRKHAARIHFVHLRSTKRDDKGNFFEADHLDGDVDMVAVIRELSSVMQRRQVNLPMRPDHGHQMLDDLNKTTYPGYSAIGRLRGLAEIRGVETAVMQLSTMA